MKKLAIIVALLVSASARAVIFSENELVVNFTNSATSITNVSWSEPGRISTTTNGLGWDGATNNYRDFWIQSIPVAIGRSWRPARGTSVVIEINPQITYYGKFFVRYSPDKKHWSSWQALDQLRGLIEVPQTASAEYDKLFSEYSKMDVPWRNDEEAGARWILQRQPDFFEKNQPFVGYVQFRMEGSLPGNQRIKQIKMRLSWGVGGMHVAPKNPDDYKTHQGPWRFETQ